MSPARASLLAIVVLAACSSSSAGTPDPGSSPSLAEVAAAEKAPEADADPATDAAVEAPKPVAAKPTVAAHPGGACSDADLSLPGSLVVGSVDGESISASELGEEVANAEVDARRKYCNELDGIRQSGLERAVDDKLLAAAAAAAGKDVDTYLRDTLEPLVPAPTDAEALAFYDANKTPDAPPFEAVADQVKGSIVQDRSRTAYTAHIRTLAAASKIERSLPEVRPAPQDVDIPEHSATFGSPNASIEIVEFSDFECPYCAQAADALTELKKNYGSKIRFAYRHYPLSFHPNAKTAAYYAQCANEQGKFWKMHDAIFAAGSLGGDALKDAAKAAGVNTAKLDACLEGTGARDEVAADMLKASEVGVGGTPTFFINGRLFNGAPTAAGLGAAIESELARAQG